MKKSIKSVTVKQIQALDRRAIEHIGVPSLALMENAGGAVAREAVQSLRSRQKAKVCIFCGLGNNAGDGFVAARHLINNAVNTKIFLIGSATNLKHDAAVHYRVLRRCRYRIQEIRSVNRPVQRAIDEADVIVDAIFGVGLNRQIKDPYAGIITALNSSKKCIIAVDTPSGLDGTTGHIYGVCVKAFKTVTFSCIKRGFLINHGPRFTGKVVVVDIGIPRHLLVLK